MEECDIKPAHVGFVLLLIYASLGSAPLLSDPFVDFSNPLVDFSNPLVDFSNPLVDFSDPLVDLV